MLAECYDCVITMKGVHVENEKNQNLHKEHVCTFRFTLVTSLSAFDTL